MSTESEPVSTKIMFYSGCRHGTVLITFESRFSARSCVFSLQKTQLANIHLGLSIFQHFIFSHHHLHIFFNVIVTNSNKSLNVCGRQVWEISENRDRKLSLKYSAT